MRIIQSHSSSGFSRISTSAGGMALRTRAFSDTGPDAKGGGPGFECESELSYAAIPEAAVTGGNGGCSDD